MTTTNLDTLVGEVCEILMARKVEFKRVDVLGFVRAAQPSDSDAEEFADDYTTRWFETEVEGALRDYAVTHDNPCGGTGYYDAGDEKPFRVLYSDGCSCESFATAEEAIEAASDYADEMDAEQE